MVYGGDDELMRWQFDPISFAIFLLEIPVLIGFLFSKVSMLQITWTEGKSVLSSVISTLSILLMAYISEPNLLEVVRL